MIKQNEEHENIYICESCGSEFVEHATGEMEPDGRQPPKCPFCDAEIETEVKNAT